MQLQVRTKIKQSYLQVKEGFNEQLFKKLNPPFPKVILKRFDGCKKGDLVNMQLNFIAFKQTWESLITADDTTEGYFFFQDEGKQLPFFLKQWKHRHWVRKVDEFNSEIVDDIHFSTGHILTDVFMYPLMKAQFLYRKPIYRKFFN
jgi:ligand-binding SRPBCC domain-containing protein